MPPISNPHAKDRGPGRAFAVAMSLLALFAAAQIGAAVWAGLHGRSLQVGTAAPSGPGEASPASAPSSSAVVPSSSSMVAEQPLQSPPAPLPPLAAPLVTPRTLASLRSQGAPDESPSSIQGPKMLLPAHQRITDPAVLAAFEDGVAARRKGDTHSALSSYRRADSLLPNHPAILHEMAQTYDSMGLGDRAHELWARVLSMGEAGAGDYHALATVHSRAGSGAVGGAKSIVRLGQLIATPSPSRPGGQEVILHVPVARGMGVAIDSQRVLVEVYFFDLVDGKRVEQSTADEPVYRWRSIPVDWRESTEPEILEVVYFHPALGPQEEDRLGRRRYHGCIVKLFYDDELQDLRAEPRTLFEKVSSGEGPRIDDTLFRLN